MINITHPVSKYGLAMLLFKNDLNGSDELEPAMIAEELKEGIRHYRFNCISDPIIETELHYQYFGLDDYTQDERNIQSAGLSNQGKYLAPNILSEEKSAKHTYNGLMNLIQKIADKGKWLKSEDFTMSVAPLAGKINNGKMSQSNPKGSLLEVACSAIAATTPIKPCFSYDGKNTCLIPDLPLDKLKEFVWLLDKIISQHRGHLLVGISKDGKFRRPRITRGNYPDAPYNPSFGAVGIAAAIGKWSKEAGYTKQGEEVLDSLKEVPIYIIQYGKAEVITYSHYLIDLAKENRLFKIIADLEGREIPSEEKRSYDNPKYKLFYMFASRFLQQFNEAAFKDFLSIRAFYRPEVIHLFNTYFMSVQNIAKEIVASARAYGQWLNTSAYWAAKENEGEHSSQEQLKKAKAKILIELESTAFAAKEPTALLAQMQTRAGRLTYNDAPVEAGIFLEAVANGTITLEQSKHLMIAFSRLRNKYEKTEELNQTPEYSLESE